MVFKRARAAREDAERQARARLQAVCGATRRVNVEMPGVEGAIPHGRAPTERRQRERHLRVRQPRPLGRGDRHALHLRAQLARPPRPDRRRSVGGQVPSGMRCGRQPHVCRRHLYRSARARPALLGDRDVSRDVRIATQRAGALAAALLRVVEGARNPGGHPEPRGADGDAHLQRWRTCQRARSGRAVQPGDAEHGVAHLWTRGDQDGNGGSSRADVRRDDVRAGSGGVFCVL